MKKILLILFLVSCEEEEQEILKRCNGTVIEEQWHDEWIPVFDCREYIVGHSGQVCPRQCCEFDVGVSCGFCEEEKE